jgi:uncharacterized protein YeeX (DUF496 family)
MEERKKQVDDCEEQLRDLQAKVSLLDDVLDFTDGFN